MYALDTNLLVYAHNTTSPFHVQAKAFIEQVMNTRDTEGHLSICLPAQILMEFLNVITWHRLEAPLPLTDALQHCASVSGYWDHHSVSTVNAP